MAFGIETLIAGGVPAAVFPTATEFWRVGDKGKLHARRVCPKNRDPDVVSVDVASLREEDLCALCATDLPPTMPALTGAVQTGRVLIESYRTLEAAAGRNGWCTIAGLQAARIALRAQLPEPTVRSAAENVDLAREVDRVCALIDQSMAAKRATLPVDLDVWIGAALIKDAAYRDDPPALAARRTALEVPPYLFPSGPHDGAWILDKIEKVVVETLLEEQDWDAAVAAGLRLARHEVTVRDDGTWPHFAALEEVVTDYISHWRTQAHQARGHDGHRPCVISASIPDDTSVAISTLRTYRRLLAPANMLQERNGHLLVGVVPRSVAHALKPDGSGPTSSPSPMVAIAGPIRDGDDDQMLQTLMRLLLENPNRDPQAALRAARGIAAPAAC